MAKDFKASQVRTTQVIASGSTAGKPSLVILSASSAGANDFSGGGFSAATAGAGKDVFVFVSGTTSSKGTNTQGVTLFGGDVHISGTLYGGVPGSDTQVMFNDAGSLGADSDFTYNKTSNVLNVGNSEIGSTGGTAAYFSHKDATVSTGYAVYQADPIAGTKNTWINAPTGGKVYIANNDNSVAYFDDDEIALTGKAATAQTVSVGSTVGASTLTLQAGTGGVTVTGDTTIAGNLTVNGTTTTVNTNNLVVKDPLIYMGSGTAGPDQNGGIALASGSQDLNKAMVWGRIATDTWGAGKQDVTAGTTSDLTTMTLVPIRSSKFEVGGTGAFISSSIGSDLRISSTGMYLTGTVAHGLNSKATGDYAVAINNSTATGDRSFAQGSGTAGGAFSIAQGENTTTYGVATHAEGSGTTAVDDAAHAEGSLTTAEGGSSHSEGYGTYAINSYSHAEGYYTTTPGAGAHSEGYITTASGDFSHSQGNRSVSLGDYSFAGGIYTIASGSGQTVLGKYNKRNNATSLFVIGNGTSDANSGRSDIFLVDTSTVRIGSGSNLGTDVFLFVSGAVNKKDSSVPSIAVFGGDVLTSGVLYTSVSGRPSAIFRNLGSDAVLQLSGSYSSGGITKPFIQTETTNQNTSFVLRDFAGSKVEFIRETDAATVAFISGSGYISGSTVLATALSGSLTKLGDGTSYLIAGNNVVITTGTNGSVTITAGVGQSTGTFNDVSGKLATTGTVSFAGNRTEGATYFANNVGADTYFFVSGSSNSKNTTTRGTSVFGGDVVISGTLFGGVTANNTYLGISANRITLAGGTLPQSVFTNDSNLYFSGSKGSKGGSTAGTAVFGGDVLVSGAAYFPSGMSGSLTKLTDGTSYLIAGTGTTITSGSTGAVTVAINNSVVATVSGTTFTGAVYTQNLFVSGNAVLAGNLTVNGSVTSVSSSNLTIADPIVYIASGSTTADTKSAIAFASGSSVANQSLIFGVVGSGNVLAAAKQDVQSGSLAQSNLSFTDLVPLRASKFEIGGSSTFLSSSDGLNTIFISSTGIKIDPGNSGAGLRLGNSSVSVAVTGSNVRIGNDSVQFGNEIPPQPGTDSYFFVSGAIGSKDTSTRGTSVFGGDVTISGTLYGGSPLKIGNSVTLTGSLYLQTQNSAPAVGSNESVLYVLDSGGTKKLYWKNSDGTQQQVGTGGSSSVTGTFNDISAKLSTTGTFAVAGNKGFNYFANNVGADVNFFVSGSIESKGTATRGTSVFGGDLLISGTTYVSNSLRIGNSTISEDSDNDLTISAGRVVFLPSETDVNAFQLVTNGAAGLRLNSGDGGLGLNSGLGQFTVTSSQVVIGSSLASTFTTPPVPGIDTFIFVSGALNSRGTSTAGVAVFGGDVVISGTIYNNAGTAYSVGGGSPGGTDTQVQFNDGGSTFGGDSGLTYTKGTDTLNVTNVSMTSTADQTWNLKDNSAGALNISAGTADNKWTFNTGDGQERLGFWDNVKAAFGDINDPDLTMYHDGTDSLIKNKTGVLILSGANGLVTSGTLHVLSNLRVVNGAVITGSFTQGAVNTQAYGLNSHAEGLGAVAESQGSHAEGYFTTAGNLYSHAEGGSTKTYGVYAHAQGYNTVASGSQSFAGGYYTIASGSGQSVLGQYNKRGNDFSLFVIGDGTATDDAGRSDILRVNSGSTGGTGRVEVTGTLAATIGLSGSLTRLTDGTSYLIAGTNVTITTGSNGAVTIASTGGGGGSGTGFNDGGNKLNTTSSVAFAGGLASSYYVDSVGSDVFFFVSGTQIQKGSAGAKTSVFGGDVVVSGVLHGGFSSLTNDTLLNANANNIVFYGGAVQQEATRSDISFFVSGAVGAKNGSNKGTAVFGGDLMLSGSTYVASGSAILPVVDRGSDLGSSSKRWGNVYTGDLHLRNDRGDWTIVEEEDYLCVVNNKTGKKFKMALIPLEE